MTDIVRTWHYGPMARHWARNNTTGPEIAYFQGLIERYGQPALDAGCGTGRLLIPFLRAGLDVDGNDASQDMLDYCALRARREGVAARLYCQPLHALDLPRQYQSIVACGVFGIGVSRELDLQALRQFHHHLQPGGVLLLEHDAPYGDADVWPLWRKDARGHLPAPWPDDVLDPPDDDDGDDAAMHYRLAGVDPFKQQLIKEMRILEFKDGQVTSDHTYVLTSNLYFPHELRLMLEAVGFRVEAMKGSWTDRDATAEDDVIVHIARKAA